MLGCCHSQEELRLRCSGRAWGRPGELGIAAVGWWVAAVVGSRCCIERHQGRHAGSRQHPPGPRRQSVAVSCWRQG
jgi:hypothetical protein